MFITVSSIFVKYSTCIQVYLFFKIYFLNIHKYIKKSYLYKNDFTYMYIYHQYTFDTMNLHRKWEYLLHYRIYFNPYICTSYKSSYVIIINIDSLKRIKHRMPSSSQYKSTSKSLWEVCIANIKSTRMVIMLFFEKVP